MVSLSRCRECNEARYYATGCGYCWLLTLLGWKLQSHEREPVYVRVHFHVCVYAHVRARRLERVPAGGGVHAFSHQP